MLLTAVGTILSSLGLRTDAVWSRTTPNLQQAGALSFTLISRVKKVNNIVILLKDGKSCVYVRESAANHH